MAKNKFTLEKKKKKINKMNYSYFLYKYKIVINITYLTYNISTKTFKVSENVEIHENMSVLNCLTETKIIHGNKTECK